MTLSREQPTKRNRTAAAKIYAAALLFGDDGEDSVAFHDELAVLAEQLLKQAKWPHSRRPILDDVAVVLREGIIRR